MKRDTSPTSGFTRADYLLTLAIADAARRTRFLDLCASEWSGTRITDTTWELATRLSPADLELAIAPHLEAGDFAAYYYLADAPGETKRLFRIVVEG